MSDSPDAILMAVSKGSSKHPKAKEHHAKRSNESSSPSSSHSSQVTMVTDMFENNTYCNIEIGDKLSYSSVHGH